MNNKYVKEKEEKEKKTQQLIKELIKLADGALHNINYSIQQNSFTHRLYVQNDLSKIKTLLQELDAEGVTE